MNSILEAQQTFNQAHRLAERLQDYRVFTMHPNRPPESRCIAAELMPAIEVYHTDLFIKQLQPHDLA